MFRDVQTEVIAAPTAVQLVVFALDESRYALRLEAVERVVRVMEITPLPVAPEIIRGVVNIQGRIVPVFHLRKRFGLPEREINLSDHLVLARTLRRWVALVVDEVTGLLSPREEQMATPEQTFATSSFMDGAVRLEDGLVFIHDLNTFLSGDEEASLERAMSGARE